MHSHCVQDYKYQSLCQCKCLVQVTYITPRVIISYYWVSYIVYCIWLVLSWSLCFLLSCLPPSSIALLQSFHTSSGFSLLSSGQILKVTSLILWSLAGSSCFIPLEPVQFEVILSSLEYNFLACLWAKFLLKLRSFLSSRRESIERSSVCDAVAVGQGDDGEVLIGTTEKMMVVVL